MDQIDQAAQKSKVDLSRAIRQVSVWNGGKTAESEAIADGFRRIQAGFDAIWANLAPLIRDALAEPFVADTQTIYQQDVNLLTGVNTINAVQPSGGTAALGNMLIVRGFVAGSGVQAGGTIQWSSDFHPTTSTEFNPTQGWMNVWVFANFGDGYWTPIAAPWSYLVSP